MDEKTGRPTVKAFAERGEAEKARAVEGGSIVGYDVLKRKDLAARCGFCDRSVYPEDVALVKIEGVHSWGCCAHCAMGCAARTGKDIEVHQPDGLTGEPVIVKTMGGYVVLHRTEDGGGVVRQAQECRGQVRIRRLLPPGVLRERGESQEMGAAASF